MKLCNLTWWTESYNQEETTDLRRATTKLPQPTPEIEPKPQLLQARILTLSYPDPLVSNRLELNRLMTKRTKWPCAKQRLRSAWTSAQSDQSLRLRSKDSQDAQADLSIRWAHMPFCWFCHEVAQLMKGYKKIRQSVYFELLQYTGNYSLQYHKKTVQNMSSWDKNTEMRVCKQAV